MPLKKLQKHSFCGVNCSVHLRECSASSLCVFWTRKFPINLLFFSSIFSSKFMVPHQQSMKLTWNQPPFGKHFSRNSTNFLDFFFFPFASPNINFTVAAHAARHIDSQPTQSHKLLLRLCLPAIMCWSASPVTACHCNKRRGNPVFIREQWNI